MPRLGKRWLVAGRKLRTKGSGRRGFCVVICRPHRRPHRPHTHARCPLAPPAGRPARTCLPACLRAQCVPACVPRPPAACVRVAHSPRLFVCSVRSELLTHLPPPSPATQSDPRRGVAATYLPTDCRCRPRIVPRRLRSRSPRRLGVLMYGVITCWSRFQATNQSAHRFLLVPSYTMLWYDRFGAPF